MSAQVIWKYVNTTGLPASVSLINEDTPIVDQLNVGSCTANSSVDIPEIYEAHCTKNPPVVLSRLFQYWNARSYVPGEDNVDGGAVPSNALEALCQYGVCLESTWPYDTTKVDVQPTANCYPEGLLYKATSYAMLLTNYAPLGTAAQCEDFLQLKAVLAMGNPVLLGMPVYQGLTSISGDFTAQQAQFSNYLSGALLGGHELVIVGYDDVNQWLIIRNSWGAGWGNNGYFAFPYQLFFTLMVQSTANMSLYFVTSYKGYVLPSFWAPPAPAPAPTPTLIAYAVDTRLNPPISASYELNGVVTNKTYTMDQIVAAMAPFPTIGQDTATVFQTLYTE